MRPTGARYFSKVCQFPDQTSLGFCGASCTTSSDNLLIDYLAGQYLVTHNCAVSPCIPMIWTGSTPQQSGPGPLYTLTSKSPLYLFAVTQGLDTRQAYDSLALAQFISPQFTGGVGITIGGSGTGYATNTTYNLSGCTYGVGSFVMVSSGGVPASITYPTTYASTGIGYGFNGCTPTVTQVGSTGSGATLTPYSTEQCGTVTVNSSVLVTVATASCATAQQYFQYAGNYSLNGYPPILTWFLSSLIDRPPQGQVRPQ